MLDLTRVNQISAACRKGLGVVFGRGLPLIASHQAENDSPSLSALFGCVRIQGVLVFLLVCTSSTWASTACVHFDAPETVACRAVENYEGPSDTSTEEATVEATFPVSSLIRFGGEGELLQLLFVVESPERTLRVMDYAPKNQLAPSLAGNVGVQSQTERSSSVGFNAATPAGAFLTASANGSGTAKNSSSARYELLPPMHLLASSGTAARGTAVYFKLKPSDQTTLDGARQFTVVFRVPHNWRADYVRLRCVAFGRSGASFRPSSREPLCGSADFLIGLYREKDPVARQAARDLVRSERELKRLAQTEQRSIERRRYGSTSDKLAVWLNLESPRIPEDWLQEVVRGESTQRDFDFQRHLPDDVRAAVQDFCEARRQLVQLSRTEQELAKAL